MKATRRQIAEANRIAARFGGWREPEEIRAMYEALEAVGITTGVITNRRDFPNLGCWQGSCDMLHKYSLADLVIIQGKSDKF